MLQLMLVRILEMEVLLLFLLVIPFILLIQRKFRSNGKLLPPGPPCLPFIGHLHMLMFDNSLTHIFLYKLSQKYGSLMSLRFGGKPVLVVSSAKMAEEVMKTHDLDFCNRPTTRCLQMLSYNGSDVAFSPSNAYWREMRKICVAHLFSSNRVLQHRPIREDEVARRIAKISKLSVDHQPVNLSEALMFLSNTVICRVGFGKRYDEEGAERCRFHGLLNESQALLSSLCFADYFPSLEWVDKLSGFVARLNKYFHELDAFYQQLIDEHLDPDRPKAEQEDLVDALLQIQKSREFAIELTLDNIKAILMNVFVGGSETSAATTVWVMTFLMKNPRYLKKVQEEVRNLVGKKDFVDEDDVKGLAYLKAVIKETFRLQPTVPLLVPREVIRNCKIDNYQIPAKTLVYVNTWTMGRDPEVWENPEEFYPERFIDNPIDFKGINFKFIPFGAGRRSCPGMHMGVAIVELALANLLYKFDWETPNGMNKEDLDLEGIPGITVNKKNDLCLLANKIN